VSAFRFGPCVWLKGPNLNSPKGQENEIRTNQANHKQGNRGAGRGAQCRSQWSVDELSRSDGPLPPLQLFQRHAYRTSLPTSNTRDSVLFQLHVPSKKRIVYTASLIPVSACQQVSELRSVSSLLAFLLQIMQQLPEHKHPEVTNVAVHGSSLSQFGSILGSI